MLMLPAFAVVLLWAPRFRAHVGPLRRYKSAIHGGFAAAAARRSRPPGSAPRRRPPRPNVRAKPRRLLSSLGGSWGGVGLMVLGRRTRCRRQRDVKSRIHLRARGWGLARLRTGRGTAFFF